MLNLGKRWVRFSHLKNTFVKIIRFGVEKMVYIACKPTSLARDLEMLQGRGYQVERMGCVDLFPGTYHVETVVRLQRKHT